MRHQSKHVCESWRSNWRKPESVRGSIKQKGRNACVQAMTGHDRAPQALRTQKGLQAQKRAKLAGCLTSANIFANSGNRTTSPRLPLPRRAAPNREHRLHFLQEHNHNQYQNLDWKRTNRLPFQLEHLNYPAAHPPRYPISTPKTHLHHRL